jgi:hypothetical protein
MAFGQPAGPPASARQIDELTQLLQRAGFDSFREARHPYGLNQRQAAGRFTVSEAEELLERLTAAETVHSTAESEVETAAPTARAAPAAAAPTRAAPPADERRDARRAQLLGSFSDAVLAGELERRGWCCIPPIAE